MIIWGILGNSERVQSVVDLWMFGDEKGQNFVRRWSTEPFFPVFSGGCLLPLFLCSRDDLVCGFIPSSNCQK